MGKLHALEGLNLDRCSNLQSLPLFIGKLHALERLNLDTCIGPTSLLEECFNKSMHLIELELKACKKLTTLPKSIVQMQKTLKILELVYCMSIEIFPTFTEQPNIMKVVEIMLEFLINFEGLKKLSMSPFKANPNTRQDWSTKHLPMTFG